ncbi:MAG: sigma-70 family RNA polymerase sigma factor [Acidobacteriales bacterium]|nr:MAG: sigma-70 family RNA polymerase sigma factor [Terriglobales bacterium]
MAATCEPKQDLAVLVREHQSMVYSLALHFLHDPAAAEELAQEVFLQLHANLPRIESGAHAAFWLRRVTCHRCVDRIRRTKQRSEVSLDQFPQLAAPLEEDDPMLSERIRKLVSSLPENLRTAVVLRYQEDLEPEEIAETLNVPVRTVKSHLQKGLALLREKAKSYLREVKE